MALLCYIRAIFRSIQSCLIVSGHNYQEIYDNDGIQVLKCETCGHLSIGLKEK